AVMTDADEGVGREAVHSLGLSRFGAPNHSRQYEAQQQATADSSADLEEGPAGNTIVGHDSGTVVRHIQQSFEIHREAPCMAVELGRLRRPLDRGADSRIGPAAADGA